MLMMDDLPLGANGDSTVLRQLFFCLALYKVSGLILCGYPSSGTFQKGAADMTFRSTFFLFVQSKCGLDMTALRERPYEASACHICCDYTSRYICWQVPRKMLNDRSKFPTFLTLPFWQTALPSYAQSVAPGTEQSSCMAKRDPNQRVVASGDL